MRVICQKEDPTELTTWGPQNPDKLKQMQDAFYAEAAKYNVAATRQHDPGTLEFPARTSPPAAREFVYTRPMTGLPQGDSPMCSTPRIPSRGHPRFPRAAPKA